MPKYPKIKQVQAKAFNKTVDLDKMIKFYNSIIQSGEPKTKEELDVAIGRLKAVTLTNVPPMIRALLESIIKELEDRNKPSILERQRRSIDSSM